MRKLRMSLIPLAFFFLGQYLWAEELGVDPKAQLSPGRYLAIGMQEACGDMGVVYFRNQLVIYKSRRPNCFLGTSPAQDYAGQYEYIREIEGYRLYMIPGNLSLGLLVLNKHQAIYVYVESNLGELKFTRSNMMLQWTP